MRVLSFIAIFMIMTFPSVADAEDSRADSLVNAAKKGDLAAVDKFIADGGSLDVRNDHGITPLIAAISGECEACIDALLAAGAKTNFRAKWMWKATPLMIAADKNDTATVRKLLMRGADIDLGDEHGDPALNWAVYYGRLETTKLLMDNGANPNLGRFGVAMEIAMRRDHLDILKYLCGQLACAPQMTATELALIEAVRANRIPSIIVFIGQGASPLGVDDTGRPLLHLAVRLGHVAATDRLLQMGVGADERDRIGFTPLMEAARNGYMTLAGLLIEARADVNAVANEGGLEHTPLQLAAIGGHASMITALIQAGANPNAQDMHGGTALFWSVISRNRRASNTLLSLGADPTIAHMSGNSPEKMAKRLGDELLLARMNAAKARLASAAPVSTGQPDLH